MTIGGIGVIGAGAWGTALAQVIAVTGQPVRLWTRRSDLAESINRGGGNPDYLPELVLAPSIRATTNLADLADADLILMVTPAQAMRAVLADLPARDRPLILCSKGIEARTDLLMAEVARTLHPDAPIAVLSGPTFAIEVARGQPTAITLACADAVLGSRLVARLARPTFRPYLTDDVVGAEIGGAVKNVLAIACGVVAGRGLGENARAALIARGYAEMVRYGLARGGRAETLTGLSGLGDLVLTCSSTASRNFSLGFGLGQGRDATSLLADRRTVAEGAFTAPVLQQSARARGVSMPVTDAVCALLSGEADADQVVTSLLARPLRSER